MGLIRSKGKGKSKWMDRIIPGVELKEEINPSEDGHKGSAEGIAVNNCDETSF